MTASTGTWSGTAPISYAYRWQRCSPGCVDIGGATASSYRSLAADVGATLRAAVTASNTAGSSEANSAQTAAVIASGQNTVTFSVSAGGDDGDPRSPATSPAATRPPALRPRTPATTSSPPADDSRSASSASWTRSCASTPRRSPTTPRSPRPSCACTCTARPTTTTAPSSASGTDAANWPIDASRLDAQPRHQRARRRRHHRPRRQHHHRARHSAARQTSPSPATPALRLGINGGQPSGDNYLQIAALEHTSAPEPQLVVTYTTSGGPTPPANTSVPVVSGVAQVGQTLSASTGSWVGDGTDLLRLPLAALQPRLRRHRRRDHEQLPGRRRRRRRDAPGRRHRLATRPAPARPSPRRRPPSPPPARPRSPSTLAPAATTATSASPARQPAGYPPTGTPARQRDRHLFTAGDGSPSASSEILTALLRFDTSALPDNATVTSAKLRLHVTGKADDDNRSPRRRVVPTPELADRRRRLDAQPRHQRAPGTDITDLTKNETAELALNGAGSISLSGYTGLRLGLSGGQPSGDNYLQIAASRTTANPKPNSSSPTRRRSAARAQAAADERGQRARRAVHEQRVPAYLEAIRVVRDAQKARPDSRVSPNARPSVCPPSVSSSEVRCARSPSARSRRSRRPDRRDLEARRAQARPRRRELHRAAPGGGSRRRGPVVGSARRRRRRGALDRCSRVVVAVAPSDDDRKRDRGTDSSSRQTAMAAYLARGVTQA